MANPIKKCVLHSVQSDGTMVDLYPRTKLASVADMTAFARTLNGAADAAAARNTLEIQTSKDIINIIYPVGSVITLTNDTDPNELYQGTTWVKMDAGRVLVSAGTYTEGRDTYTYTLGDKGGEAKHQLTTKELAAHIHSASSNTTGGHKHDANVFTEYGGNHGGGATQNNATGNNQVTGYAGDHWHTISIGQTGGNVKHENRMPYETVIRWKRTD